MIFVLDKTKNQVIVNNFFFLNLEILIPLFYIIINGPFINQFNNLKWFNNLI